jgi:cupin 2 domain-containing protein
MFSASPPNSDIASYGRRVSKGPLEVIALGDNHAWTFWDNQVWKLWEISMTVLAGNLFADVSVASAGDEVSTEIFARPGLKIERIVSQGQASPPEFWYDQAWNEWVIVLKGSATLQFEDEPATRAMRAGDYVFIPARKRHRVEWTEPQQPTVWLAVHFG